MPNNEKLIMILQGKLRELRIRCHESARDSFDSGMYVGLHIVTVDELKNLNEKIAKLETKLSNVKKTCDDYYKKCIDLTNQIEELESELEVKDNLLKIKNGLCKPPMMKLVVSKTINGQDYVRLEDFMSVVNDLKNYDLYHAE